ncbi:MAG: FecR family protein [Bacteroidetes bacterium]|nr:FecR family protein [Bacteroidota bacterium]
MNVERRLTIARKIYLKLAAIFLMSVVPVTSYSQSFSTEKIIYHNQDLRSLAEKYFDDPDLWEVILTFNNLGSLSELKDGLELIIPSGIVNNTLSSINETNSTIRKATENGAKIFTPELINGAIQKLNISIQEKNSGQWQSANSSIKEALRLAKESLEQSQLLRNQSADATISFRKGDVQNRKPSQQIWSNAPVFTKLYEEDRARTLTESFAEITFIDLSRIRLNENSQALIQRTRLDLLNNQTETTVKLIKGDAFAYLLNNPKKKFDIDIPGLDSKIKSKSFWIEKEEASTKIANYDGQIELKARDSSVIVKENQGSIIPAGGLPSKPMDLLPSPILESPVNEHKFYAGNFEFIWRRVDNVKQYWFEIAEDQSFKKLIYSNKLISNESVSIKSLIPKVYYWHVASIDKFGFPGKFGNYNYFIVLNDETKPYLNIKSPYNQLITKSDFVIVEGETEPVCMLTINGSAVEIAADGKFSYTLFLKDGYNKISIEVTDEAGNKTVLERSVICELKPEFGFNILSPNYKSESNTVYSNSYDIYITGKTRPLSQIDISLDTGVQSLRAYADTNGVFTYKIAAEPLSKTIIQEIHSPAAYSRVDSIKIQIDKEAPLIKLSNSLPSKTSTYNLLVEGKVFDADTIFINGKILIPENDNFSQNISLAEGKNTFLIIAKDIAGNSSEIKKTIILDTSPPELISYKISKKPAGDNIYNILVEAKDNTELKKIATAVILINEVRHEQFLKLNNNNNFYESSLSVNGKNVIPKLMSVTLEDYLNNKKEYLIK